MKIKKLKIKKEKRMDFGRSVLSVNEDSNGEIIIIEEHGPLVIKTWRLIHLINLAKRYEEKLIDESVSERLTQLAGELKTRIGVQQNCIDTLLSHAMKEPRFGWKK